MAKPTTEFDFSMFATSDLVNLVLQRSEILSDVPRSGRVIKAWSDGDARPLEAIVSEKGVVLAERAFDTLFGEFEILRGHLDAMPPKRVADIGCGYAFVDLFLARSYDPEFLLIDVEDNEHRHFGFKAEGAAYSSLPAARAFLTANGVADKRIVTVNPKVSDAAAEPPVDLALSLLSCGFHYPIASYMDYFRTNVVDGGVIVVDLRAAKYDAQRAELEAVGSVEDIYESGPARRVLVRKSVAKREV